MSEIQHPSKDEGLRDIGYSMTIVIDTTKISFCESIGVQVSYLVHYDTLLQSAIDIITAVLLQNVTKKLLQNTSGFLLQNKTTLL